MFRYVFLLLVIVFVSTGCDRITGVAEQKMQDAEAIGYSCRVSLKKPGDCISDNEKQSPSSILVGWKKANQDIDDNKLDPNMGVKTVAEIQAAAALAAAKQAGKGSTLSVKADSKPKTAKHKSAQSH
ncbi:MAG: hypothetical protein R8K48_02660 [Gallionella sp.]